MNTRSLLLLTPLVLGGCNLATVGNLFLVAVTLGLFCFTLSLGQRTRIGESQDAADRESLGS